MNSNNSNQTAILAGSILIGFALIAAAIFFSNTTMQDKQVLRQAGSGQEQGVLVATGSPKREEGEPRRLYGNPDAETTIVEFSDFECPFCSRVHPTLKQIVDESEGQINWEYRHLPLSIHANAEPAAIASECVGDLAGNDAFWSYSTQLLSNQRGLTAGYLESEAVSLGVDTGKYQACIASDVVARRVNTDSQRALSLGGSGTPFSVVEFADGTTRVASGALPYANWMSIFNSVN